MSTMLQCSTNLNSFLNIIEPMDKISSIKDFQILTKLGEGAFGVVFKVKRRADGKEYAMKKVKLISMKEKERENAVNQIRILASLDDDFIIGFKDTFYDDVSSMLCIVMEYASGGDVLKKINSYIRSRTRYQEDEIWKALVHMAKGLKTLHDNKILHRDLKCANVFITADGVYKLGDLNVSKVLKKGLAYTQTGTPYYASPEVWSDKPYDMKSDIWSLGCVVYEMAALKPPFQATDLQGLFKKVKAGVFDRIPSVYSSDLAAIIAQMLKITPSQRPSTDQILSNPIVARHFTQGGLLPSSNEKAELLQTIRFNNFNLKALKEKLPKSNYVREKKEDEKDLSLDRISTGPRDRAMSACGIRNVLESPRQMRPKKQQPQPQIFSHKNMDNNPAAKLPPLPNKGLPRIGAHQPANYQGGGGGYYLPSPRVSRDRSGSKEKEGDYKQYLSNKQPNSSDKERQKSKEHLRNIGANIVNNSLPRSNSVHKIAPDW